jgi:hypothetical protein
MVSVNVTLCIKEWIAILDYVLTIVMIMANVGMALVIVNSLSLDNCVIFGLDLINVQAMECS